MTYRAWWSLSLSLSWSVAGCGAGVPIDGLARVSHNDDAVVFTMCDTDARYELGAVTSNAAFDLDDVLADVGADGEAWVTVHGVDVTDGPTSTSVGGTRRIGVGHVRRVARPEGCDAAHVASGTAAPSRW